VGVALLLLAACGGGPGGGDGAGTTVVIGVHTEPEALNPYGPAGEVLVVYELLTATKVPPYVQAPDQTWTPSELLDGEAELTTDPMTLTRIHPDATWSDGVPVSARNFVFTWETIMDPGLEISGRVGVEDISDAEVIDDKTVRFTFARPYAPWRLLFNLGVLPAHVLEGEGFDTAWLEGPTVRAGPYRLVEWRKGIHLLLERNPHWWGRHAEVSRLRYQVFTDPTSMVQALVSGERDVIDPYYDGVAQLRRDSGVRLDTALADSWAMLVLHPDVPHRVRAAVAHGLDRDALAEVALHEVIDEPRRLDSLVFAPRPADTPASFARYDYDYDPDRARLLLSDSDAPPALRWLDENSGPLHTARFEVAQSPTISSSCPCTRCRPSWPGGQPWTDPG
jgi:ABC-type transport system substrate-binding protein